MSAPLLGSAWQIQLGNLKPDWDSYGAPAISKDAIATLEHFAVVPCSDGGIQLEVHRDGFNIEIEIAPDGTITQAIGVALEPKW